MKQKLKRSDGMSRIFAVGDIHGCCRTFQRLLDHLDLLKSDQLFLLGDLIDRGPDSRGVLDTIMRLLANGFDVRPLLGNHEALLLKAIDSGLEEDIDFWWLNGGDATLKSFGVNHPREIPQPYIKLIRNQPLLHVDAQFVLVHAGLDFSTKHPLTETSREDMLWTRIERVIPEKIGRTVLTGHTMKRIEEIESSLHTHHVFTDAGCVSRAEGLGNLVAIDLESRKLFIQRFVG
jgi:serine/threonine protein phosphatase 1